MEGKTEVQRGFVCSDWAKSQWNPEDCEVVKTTSGEDWAVIDHRLQITIFVGSEQECVRFLGRNPEAGDFVRAGFYTCGRCGSMRWSEDGCSCDD
jgi:hypothetical protein